MKRLLAMLAAGLSMVTIALSVAAIGLPAAAQAATVPNDSFTGATVITSLPFSTTQDTSQATSDPSDPSGCSSNGSVWYSFTPSSDMQIEADTSGSNYNAELSAWTGTQGALNQVACNDDVTQSRISFAATAGTTYYFMVGQCCGGGGNGGGNLQLSVRHLVPPGNDDFANATPVSALPFSDTQDLTLATAEFAEPGPGCFDSTNTVWYSFTAKTTESIMATTNQFGIGVSVYTGNSLASLSQLGCTVGDSFSPLTFRAQAGVTYYFQVAEWSNVGLDTFGLEVAPNPTARFGYNPDDPSSFDAIQFFDDSGDPAGAGISSWAWDFGDGATSTQQDPTHRYAADGDYTVHLTVTTTDGRTASTSQVVQVLTHDVAITKLAVPTSAHAGQTFPVTAYLQNTRYPETVEINLYKGVPSGFTQVGSLTESVPVKRVGQTTRFDFSYTVTSDDKAIGKITFEVTASIIGFRDALPADNTLLSHLVKVG